MNLSKMIETNSKRIPGWPAVISEDRQLTWAEFNLRVSRIGSALRRLGVKKGDRVAIYLPNSPEYLIAYFAVARVGAVAVPFNIMYRSAEIQYIINNSGARILVAASAETGANVVGIMDRLPTLEHLICVGENPVAGALPFSDLLAEGKDDFKAVDCALDDVVTIMYTSGTTGVPKGAMLTNHNFWEQADLNSCYILHINDRDRLLTGAPFCHIFFVTTVLGPMYKGAAVVTMPRFFPGKALEMISKFRVTHFAGVPTMYIYMLQHYRDYREKHDLKAWRVAKSAGAAMPAEYISRIEETFGVDFCECYGATETSSACAYGRLGHGKAGSVGLPAHSWEVKIVDDGGRAVPAGEIGEIIVKGPGVLKGYWNMPEATASAFTDGWLHTGDLARADEEGYIYIVDRKKDMLICSGYNIYPREVEEVLFTHPAVLEVAVVGIPDSAKGEIPKAFIVLKPDMQAEAADIIAFCKERLVAYKAPRVIEFCTGLPKSPTGKIIKRKLFI
ncbi:MAG: class I adenylate-forming enzyme family protein [Desulfocucumaceae bacterium]